MRDQHGLVSREPYPSRQIIDAIAVLECRAPDTRKSTSESVSRLISDYAHQY